MKEPVKIAEHCMDSLQMTADALVREGATWENIIAALMKVTVAAAKKCPDPVSALDTAGIVLMNAAGRVSAKKAGNGETNNPDQ